MKLRESTVLATYRTVNCCSNCAYGFHRQDQTKSLVYYCTFDSVQAKHRDAVADEVDPFGLCCEYEELRKEIT